MQHELHDCGTVEREPHRSALSSAVRGIKGTADGERLSRFGRLKLGHNGRGRTRVPNEERELPDV